MKAARPKAGCARCLWWLQNPKKDYGLCALNQLKKGWQAPPCPEYVTDPYVPNEIDLT